MIDGLPQSKNTPSTLPAVKECMFPKIMKRDQKRTGREGRRRWEKRFMESEASSCCPTNPVLKQPTPTLPFFFTTHPLSRSQPPAHNLNGSHLILDTWHSTMSAPQAKGDAFKEIDSHMRAAVENRYY